VIPWKATLSAGLNIAWALGSRSHKTCHKVTIAVFAELCYISHRAQVGSMSKALKYCHSLGFQGSCLKTRHFQTSCLRLPPASPVSHVNFSHLTMRMAGQQVIQKSSISFLILSLLLLHTKSCPNIYYGQSLFIDIIYHHSLRFALCDSLIQ
jgi:hypothetical protein